MRRRIVFAIAVLELFAFWIARQPVSHLAGIFSPRLEDRSRRAPPRAYDSHLDVRVYDVRDIIILLPDGDNRPMFDRPPMIPHCSDILLPTLSGPTRQEICDKIISEICDWVDPPSWRDNIDPDVRSGGEIRELGGQLIVTQTPYNQAGVACVLEGIRLRRDLENITLDGVPYAVAGTPLLLIVGRTVRRRRRETRRGRCLNCGCDLRATPMLCPEWVVHAKTTSQ